MINIIPLNDYEEHEESTTCKCSPKIEFNKEGELIVIHNSFDGRENTEGFNKVVDIFK